MNKDTIAAIATGMTDAGIGIVRISGTDAVEIGDRVFKAKSKKKLCEQKSHTMHYGMINDGEELIDEALVSIMLAPHSYTGEDTVEINCHGGMYVINRILKTVLLNGARLAEPGEFTKRAFLNGKMDLSKAEAVMDLIHSKNDFALKNSLRQLSGSLSNKIRQMREEIIYEIAFIESALDDPEHISLDGYPERLQKKINQLISKINELKDSFTNGRIRKEGIRTVIVGKPNAGKSSLLNALSGEERAIVTSIAGTTRDVLEESVRIGDVVLNLVDTAGIREASDEVEKIGVSKAKQYVEQADLILYVVDSSIPLDENDEEIISLIYGKQVIVLLNKSDLETVTTKEILLDQWVKAEVEDKKNNKDKIGKEKLEEETDHLRILNISLNPKDTNLQTVNSAWREEFKEEIHKMFFSESSHLNDEIVITNLRHVQELEECRESLILVLQSIDRNMSEDFFSIDLTNAYVHLGNIIGEEISDDLMDEIFSKFCMGK